MKEKIKSDFLSGLSYTMIAEKYKISKTTIYRILKLLNISEKDRNHKNPKLHKNIDILNQKFNYLTVLEKIYNTKLKRWDCKVQCECGNIVIKQTNHIITGRQKTCGDKICKFFKKIKKEIPSGKNRRGFTGFEKIHGSYWNHIKATAKNRNLEFNLNIENVWDLYLLQNKKCKISGIDIVFGKSHTKERTASLDRINSSKGYVIENVQWVHKKINMMKQSLSDEELITWCNLIVSHNS